MARRNWMSDAKIERAFNMILPGFSQAYPGISGIRISPYSSDDSLDGCEVKATWSTAAYLGLVSMFLVCERQHGEITVLTADLRL